MRCPYFSETPKILNGPKPESSKALKLYALEALPNPVNPRPSSLNPKPPKP